MFSPYDESNSSSDESFSVSGDGIFFEEEQSISDNEVDLNSVEPSNDAMDDQFDEMGFYAGSVGQMEMSIDNTVPTQVEDNVKNNAIINEMKEKEQKRHAELVARIRQQGAFCEDKWRDQDRRKFEILVALLGPDNTTWQIIRSYQHFQKFLRNKISTHLQKYKKAIRQQNGIPQGGAIKNTMYDKKSKNSDILSYICKFWENPAFKGFTDEEINYFLSK